MRLCVFVYNFPHRKSYDGLKLLLEKFDVGCVLAANRVNIDRPKSRIVLKSTPSKSIDYSIKAPYHVVDHNKSSELIKKSGCDCGVVLGARILRKDVVGCFPLGVLNLHPGILPYNRGLDCMKWAVHLCLPQCVTSHKIGKNIDDGEIIDRRVIDVIQEDTFDSIGSKLYDAEMSMLVDGVRRISKGRKPDGKIGKYHSFMDPVTEDGVIRDFDGYKESYPRIKGEYGVIF